MMATKRIEYIDPTKGFCILLVVIFHLSIYYNVHLPAANFLKAFRMPLYFILSGFFFKEYEGFSGYLKRKINKLLIPFVFFYLTLSVALSLLLFHFFYITLERAANFQIIPTLTEFFWREEFPNSPIWFLLSLFEINIFFYVIFLISKRFNKSVLCLSICSFFIGFCGLLLSYYRINLPCFIDSSMTATPFFCMGYILNRHTNVLSTNIYDKYIPLIVILCFAFVFVLCGYVDYKHNSVRGIASFTAYPCGLIGTIAILFIAKWFKKLPCISYWGRYSIIILVTHRMVYQLYSPIFDVIGMTGWSAMLSNYVLTMFSYFVIIPFCIKYMPHVTAQKDLIKV